MHLAELMFESQLAVLELVYAFLHVELDFLSLLHHVLPIQVLPIGAVLQVPVLLDPYLGLLELFFCQPFPL